jgi:hypothetical protein
MQVICLLLRWSVLCQIGHEMLGQVAGLTFVIERLIMPRRAWYAKVK